MKREKGESQGRVKSVKKKKKKKKKEYKQRETRDVSAHKDGLKCFMQQPASFPSSSSSSFTFFLCFPVRGESRRSKNTREGKGWSWWCFYISQTLNPAANSELERFLSISLSLSTDISCRNMTRQRTIIRAAQSRLSAAAGALNHRQI